MIIKDPMHPPQSRSRAASNLTRGLIWRCRLLLLVLAGACTGGGSESDPPLTLDVDPDDAILLTMLEGSPPATSTLDFQLRNGGQDALHWKVLASAEWLKPMDPKGQLAPGATKSVQVGIEGTVVSAMKVGKHEAAITFNAESPTEVLVSVPVRLTVLGSQASGTVEPESAFHAQGPLGGHFKPELASYTITNATPSELHWEAIANQAWIGLAPEVSGALASGASTAIQVLIDQPIAAGLAEGTHEGQVTFKDSSSGEVFATRDVLLEVLSDNNWTSFSPSTDTRIVYVSSSQGSDANDGLSAALPKRTLREAKTLLRDGYPDWILLRKGDVWNEDLGVWSASGRSIAERMLISSYGTGPRPTIRPLAGNNGISVWDPFKPQYLALVDIHFIPQSNPTEGRAIAWYSDGGKLLVEGCLIENFDIAFLFQGGHDVTIRRNVAVNSDGQGAYVQNVSGFLFEENLIDKSGFPDPNYYKHALYIDNEGMTNVVVRGNIFTEASSNGIYLRPGGVCENNLVARCGIAIELGGGDSWQSNPDGVTAEVRDNVILDGKDISAAQPRGWGMLMQNIASAHIENNLIANIGECNAPFAFEVDGWSNGAKAYNVSLRNNVVFGWRGESLRIKGVPRSQLKDLTVEQNEFQNEVSSESLIRTWDAGSTAEIASNDNRFHSIASLPTWFNLAGTTQSLDAYKSAVSDTSSTATQLVYNQPDTATLAGYHAHLGKTASYEAFMAEVRKQSKDEWRPEYTAASVNSWLRSRFKP
jgi:Right handed beta helix region